MDPGHRSPHLWPSCEALQHTRSCARRPAQAAVIPKVRRPQLAFLPDRLRQRHRENTGYLARSLEPGSRFHW